MQSKDNWLRLSLNTVIDNKRERKSTFCLADRLLVFTSFQFAITAGSSCVRQLGVITTEHRHVSRSRAKLISQISCWKRYKSTSKVEVCRKQMVLIYMPKWKLVHFCCIRKDASHLQNRFSASCHHVAAKVEKWHMKRSLWSRLLTLFEASAV